ncbi:MAG: flagellar export chaperone FlgN [Pseudomonas sp.]|uniref:flagellar export chaperone FlgN n=1 Tax=Pseudomonas sp. TaxID=306 RepID=UPI00339399F8
MLSLLAQDVQDDLLDYQRLDGLLPELHQALLRRDNGRIGELNAQIEPCCEQLRMRAQRRSKALAALGLGGGAVAMNRLLQHYPAEPRRQLETGWQRLGEAAVRCADCNERNGRLLAMHHEIIEQLLGDSTRRQLYAPHGHAY